MIAVVIPTIREESFKTFVVAWEELFRKHNVKLIVVKDGKTPYVSEFKYKEIILDFNNFIDNDYYYVNKKTLREVMGEYKDVIYNLNDGVRNLGFAYVARYLPEIDTIISFDDDVAPLSGTDPIQEHFNVLGQKVPNTWVSTANHYTRGFPYGIRKKAEIVLSHGVWSGVADWDAPTQLVFGNRQTSFFKGIIPKGALFPLCAMNFAFSRKVLPYVYQAPMGPKVGLDRFADIWGGIEAKKDIDRLGMAVVSGFSTINHTRASNVYTNLIKEAKGLKMNEEYGQDPYFELFFKKRQRWGEFLTKYESKKI